MASEESPTLAFLSVALVAACARVYHPGEWGIADMGIFSVALMAACAHVYYCGEWGIGNLGCCV